MTDIELMQQALEALETKGEHHPRVYAAITALRERLAQPEQEPVAWHPIETAPKDRTVLVCRRHSTIPTMAKWNAEYEWFDDLNMDHLYDVTHWMPLPPAPGTSSRQWQGLTDEEREQFRQWVHPDIIEAIELRLQERNR